MMEAYSHCAGALFQTHVKAGQSQRLWKITPFLACCWSDQEERKVWCRTVTAHRFFSLLTGGTFLQRLTLRVTDKFSTHDLTSEVTGLYVTTESSNLAISSMDRPGLGPNLRGLSGQLFLVVYSLSRRWQVQVEVQACSLQKQILQVCTDHRRLFRKKRNPAFMLWSLRWEQTHWPNRLTSLHSGRQSRLSSIDVKCHLKLVVLPRGKASPFPFLLHCFCFLFCANISGSPLQNESIGGSGCRVVRGHLYLYNSSSSFRILI